MDYLRFGRQRTYASSCLQPVEVRHTDVEHNQVWLQFLRLADPSNLSEASAITSKSGRSLSIEQITSRKPAKSSTTITRATNTLNESLHSESLPGLLHAKQYTGALSFEEIRALVKETELRLHECTVCGRQNLYPVKGLSGDWALEPHSVPEPEVNTNAAFLLGE
jgi:hypothetical protein